ESLAMFRELGDGWSVALSLANMGLAGLNIGEGDVEALLAAPRLREALAMFRELGVRQGIATCLEGLAGVAGREGRGEEAAKLFGAAEALREAISVPLPAYDRADYERSVSIARAPLGESAFEQAWEEGRRTPLDEI